MPEPIPSRLMTMWKNTGGGMPEIMVAILRMGKE
jgi:hypothetical protein